MRGQFNVSSDRNKQGQFIVFEGIDGSGKTTQLRRFADYLAAKGLAVRCEKEPTDGPIGTRARAIVKSSRPVLPEQLAKLFAADRVAHLRESIAPALSLGEWVICDRFLHSNLAYQSTALPMVDIVKFNAAAMQHPAPDAVFFIDTPPEIAVSRVQSRNGGGEMFDTLDYACRLRTLYGQAFALVPPAALFTIDGSGTPDTVFARVVAAFEGGALCTH